MEHTQLTGTLATHGVKRIGIALGVLAVAVVVWTVFASHLANAKLREQAEAQSVLTVATVKPQPQAAAADLTLPGSVEAYNDAPIYARTNGYLKSWYVDIGGRVKQGQLLAEIDTPEVDQALAQARADLDVVRANLRQAEITANRWRDLLRTDSVSQQETDQAVNNFHAGRATVEANLANVRRLEELQGFQKIVAPFDGVITARRTDIGALIDAGANAPGRELFRLAATDRLRVYVPVPEVFSRAAKNGVPATLTLDLFPGRKFRGTVVRNASAIDLTSRTLLVEVDVENSTGELLPGAYAFVHLQLARERPTVTIPAGALLFRAEGLQVGVVKSGVAQLVSVTIGHDYGEFVEIVAGLDPTDQVIAQPSDSLISGTRVRIANAPGPGPK